MNTRNTLTAVAAILAVGSTLAYASTARADSAATAAPAAVYAHQGIGTGSVKTAPFNDNAYQAQLATQHVTLFFHTSNGQPAQPNAAPSAKSVKAPGVH